MKRSRLRFDPPRGWLLLLFLLVVGCERQLLPPLPADGVILAFGDSLTVGVGADSSRSYPSVLEELTGLRVVNAGVSGETTRGGLARLPAVLTEVSPDLVILMEGGNDILRSKHAQVTRDNLAAMVELVLSAGSAVVLVGVPNRMLFNDSAPFYDELATRFDIPLVDGELASLLRDPRYKSDPIHLNAEGYALLAGAIHEALIAHGAL
jgi:lysophospholipase L1-like esterase